MATPDFDVVIIGAGAGGGVAAWALAKKGLRVALVEKGRNPYPTLGQEELRGSLFGNDELRGRRFYAFQDPLLEPRLFRNGASEAARRIDVQGLGVGVGGGTVQYDADSPRVTRADLTLRSTFGAIEGADVVDWPISWDELAPFYDATEVLVGVQGAHGGNPFEEPRGPYPMPPGSPSKIGLKLSAAARRLGLHPHAMPMAINSTAYGGRPACVNCGFCRQGCPINAKGSTAVTVIHEALRTRNCTLLAETCVTAIQTEPSGARATGVAIVDPTGAPGRITANHVIVAANGIETPRLLLSSSSAAHPDGLGNASGLVGRYLMFHLVFAAIGVFEEELRSYRGRPITHALADFTVSDGSPDFVRGGYVELGGSLHAVEEGIGYPWLFHRTLMDSGRYRRRMAPVSMIAEDLPVFENRVELDPSLHDVYGRPVARITYGRHPYDEARVRRWFPRLEEIAREAGAKDVLQIDLERQGGRPETKHLLGTARMGRDPASSVVDPQGRLHACENVWIADGSTWPTSTAWNPTLTQQALALRTAGAILDPTDPAGVLR